MAKSTAAHFDVKTASITTKEAKELLEMTFSQKGHPMPICLCGDPGVGKSQIIQQVCREFGVTEENGTYHEVRLSTCVDSADITGLPYINKRTANVSGKEVEFGHTTIYSKPKNIPFLEHDENGNIIPDDRLHVLFFDEVNRGADPSIMNAIFQILTEYGVANHKLVPNCIILLAMNPEATGYAVNEMCPALVNRMNIQYVRADLTSWLEWARDPEQGNIGRLVTDFLDNNPNYFVHNGIVQDVGQDKRFYTPRAWVNLYRNCLQVNKKLNYKTASGASYAIKMIGGYVGWQAATQFVSFARTAVEDRPLTGMDVLKNYSTDTGMQDKVKAVDESGIRLYDAAKTTTTLNSLQDEFKSRGTKITPKELRNMLTFLCDIEAEHAFAFQNFLLQGIDNNFTQWFFSKVGEYKELMELWAKVKDGVTKAGVGNASVI